MVSAFISVGLSLLIIVVIRIWKILPPKIGLQNAITKQRRKATAIIVLGSGGHTGEMLRLSSQLDINKYIFHYIYAASDKRSIISLNSHDKLAEQPHKIHSIPRSREVYQSYFTSIFTTLYALLVSIYIVLRINPDLVLCNGPGTCVPICIAAYIPRFFGFGNPKLVYVESAARVKQLSTTGKILIWIVDLFYVQWEPLAKKYPSSHYLGVVL